MSPNAAKGNDLWLRLALTPQFSAKHYQTLLKLFPQHQSWSQLSHSQWSAIGLSAAQIHCIEQPDVTAYQQALVWLSQPNHHLLTLTDSHYPSLLAEISDPPPCLWVIGDVAALSLPQIAIVGARQASHYGKQVAMELAQQLAQQGWAVTSGLASGIDSAAHRGCLAGNGVTTAVLGGGFEHIYPATNRPLAQQIIAAGGLLVSEFPLMVPPLPHHFPQRNRIVTGLARGTLVVEASERSGSLISARLAMEQNREVFAVPGLITNPNSLGCHRLVQQGAKLVTNVADILEELVANYPINSVQQPVTEKSPTSQLPFAALLDTVDYEMTTLDMVVARSGLPITQVQSQLTELELLGWVAAVPGGYVKLRRG